MTAQRFEEALRAKLISHVIKVLWDGKPRTNTEIAQELQQRFPIEFFEFNTDLLAQDIYAYVTARGEAMGMMSSPELGKYSITEENKKGGWSE